MWVSRYVIWFILYSVLGWVWESSYCTVTERKWENRGFLYGPLCPIYGTGVILMLAVWQEVQAHGLEPSWVQVFLIAAAGSAVLEYATSWVLEKLFHARWWDYTDMPLNLNGRICLPATVLFGLAGLLVAYVLYDPTMHLTDDVAPELIEALSLVLVALVSVDATLTVSALTAFAQTAQAITDNVNAHMDAFVDEAVARESAAVRTFEEERESFAASVRNSRLGEMGGWMKSAAARVRTVGPQGREAGAGNEQLHHLWADLRDAGRRV